MSTRTSSPPASDLPPASAKARLFDDERAGEIYRTAARIIDRKGFGATSMNEIAEACDLTKPGLYYYVKGKHELLFAIMSYAMDLLEDEVVGPAGAVADPEERLRLVIRQHARLLLLNQDSGALGILMDEVGALREASRKVITARKRNYFEILRRTLAELRGTGRLRPVDPTVAAFSLLGMVMWLARWFDAEGRLPRSAVVDDLVEMAVASVLVETARSPLLA